MLNHINQNLQRHIVTIENPIEFLHRDVKCSVTQREVGVDTESFAVGLQAALRQDPDVVVISELRDGDTLETAVRAAETGHLVISAMPTHDVEATLGRVHSMFPMAEREIGRLRLSEALRGVVAQRLLPRKDDSGRVAALEVLVGTPATRACMREGDEDELVEEMEGGDQGMQTFEQHVGRLVKAGEISKETAQVITGGKGSKKGER
jgi:twitching motility protein PilT